MKTTHTLLAAGVLALFAGAAMADSSSGMQTTGAVSAKATVNLSVSVPKVILLKVGSSSAISTASFTVAPTVAGAGNNNPINNWDGTGPAMTTTASGNALDVAAWTNISGGAKLNYSADAFGTGGPTLADFEVTSANGTGLAHPGSKALGAGGTDVTVAANTLSTATWTYSVAAAATPSAWQAGSYTTKIVYTATAP